MNPLGAAGGSTEDQVNPLGAGGGQLSDAGQVVEEGEGGKDPTWPTSIRRAEGNLEEQRS